MAFTRSPSNIVGSRSIALVLVLLSGCSARTELLVGGATGSTTGSTGSTGSGGNGGAGGQGTGDPCPGATLCKGLCVDTSQDPANCGGCGIPCDPGGLCSAGKCIPSCAGILCPMPLDDCHLQGSCDPSTGACSNPTAPDGAPCEDGLATTSGDRCLAGVCTPAATCNDGVVNQGEGDVDCGGPCPATCVGASPKNPGVSCQDILFKGGSKGNKIYWVDPDGDGGQPPFLVACDMVTAGGGWTLVGRELPYNPSVTVPTCGSSTLPNGVFRYLSTDTGNAAAMAQGAESGLIGRRFSGKYGELWINWAGARFVRGKLSGFDAFGNTINKAAPLSGFSTNDPALAGWVSAAGGAVLCVASRDGDVRPGDTSWAVKPQDDMFNDCGCNSGGWWGRGVFYGGTRPDEQTTCCGHGGGWSGAADLGQQKGGIYPSYEAQIWIR